MAQDDLQVAQPNGSAPLPSPVQDMSDTGDGRKLLEQAMGITAKASDLEDNNAAIKQYDYRGDKAEVAPLPTADAVTGAFGASGTVIFAGFIAQEEYNHKLIGRQGLLKYDEMRKSDATIRWSLQVIKLPIRSAEWRIQAASDDPRDIEIADFVSWNLFERLSWTSVLREIMTYLDFGFFVGEKSFVVEDYQPKPIKLKSKTDADDDPKVAEEDPDSNKPDLDEPEMLELGSKPMIVLHELAGRKQTTIFRWEQGDGSPGITQVTAQGTFDIPENRLFILTHEREGNNYYGVSLMRSAYKHWYMKDALYKIEAVAAERQGVGVVKIRAVTKPGQEELNKAIEAAENLRANESGYLVEPENFDLQFMDMMAKGVISVGASIEHHNREIMMNVGAAFMEMGASRSSGSTGGSRSASNDQAEVYNLAVEATANEVEEAFNSSMVIKQLVDLNYTNVTNYPQLQHNKIGQDDLMIYANAVSALLNADALTPDPDMEQTLRERVDLPDLPDSIRANWKSRQRSQASTVPENQPGAPTDGSPVASVDANGKPVTPTTGKTPPAEGTPPIPPKPAVQATELVDKVKRIYNIIGDGLDAVERAD